MLAYIARRFAIAIPIILVSTFVVFLLVSMSGDPLDSLRNRNPPTPRATIQLEQHRLHLDKPVLERYAIWMKGLSHGDFGPSIRTNMDIGHEIFKRFIITFRLVFFAMLLAVILAIIVGVVSAVKQYSGVDYAFTFVGFLFLAMPVFWFAILLKQGGIWFNRKVGDQVFFTIGDRSIIAPHGAWAQVTDLAGHIVLPTIVLAMTSFAAWSRFQRSSMLDVLNSDYIRLARAKGLSRRKVMVRHALRTALIPLVTVTALDLAAIISGAVITETVFQWHGMGDFLISSINALDAYAVLAWLLITALAVIVFNLIADLLYAVLDPRIRYE
jgi:peptide/nickel transport system permease protein